MRGESWRDRLAWMIIDLTLKHIATPHYRDMIAGSIRLGMATAAARSDDEVESIIGDANARLQHHHGKDTSRSASPIT